MQPSTETYSEMKRKHTNTRRNNYICNQLYHKKTSIPSILNHGSCTCSYNWGLPSSSGGDGLYLHLFNCIPQLLIDIGLFLHASTTTTDIKHAFHIMRLYLYKQNYVSETSPSVLSRLVVIPQRGHPTRISALGRLFRHKDILF